MMITLRTSLTLTVQLLMGRRMRLSPLRRWIFASTVVNESGVRHVPRRCGREARKTGLKASRRLALNPPPRLGRTDVCSADLERDRTILSRGEAGAVDELLGAQRPGLAVDR